MRIFDKLFQNTVNHYCQGTNNTGTREDVIIYFLYVIMQYMLLDFNFFIFSKVFLNVYASFSIIKLQF